MKKNLIYSFFPFLYLFLELLILATQVKANQSILFLGDSLTEGYGIKKELAYPKLIEKKLHAEGKKNYSVINAGDSGSKSSSAYSRLKWQLRAHPSILVLALGANDGLQGVDPTLTKQFLKKTIALALENKMKILLVGIKMPMNYGDDFRKKFEALFLELSEEYKSKISFLPFLLEGVGGIKGLNQTDGIHPNEKGHQIMAETVLRSLRPLL